MNSSSADFETIKSYLAYFFVDCKYIVEDIKDLIEKNAKYEMEYGGYEKIANEKEIKKIIKKVISKHDRNMLIKMTKFIKKIYRFQHIENIMFFKNNSDKNILKMINKKYKHYTENGIDFLSLENIDIIESALVYNNNVDDLSDALEFSKYDIKYV
jgi:6-pyruvoyl-tetrahydropterin synthase